jgi:hypothetical protein
MINNLPEPCDTASASGERLTVARVAGLIATALLGFVFARQESIATFIVGFRAAALIGAASAATAAACALLLIRPDSARFHKTVP